MSTVKSRFQPFYSNARWPYFSDKIASHPDKVAQNRKGETGMKFDDLTEEQKAKAMACKTTDELIALAKAEGVELSDEQLNSIAGGDSFWCPTATSCPNYEVMR